ncbi:hypothetical protein PG993_007023 [Apiospora rasikravindrae]|uniref:2EXR domain-containing protein n=1 Tax=Apiospora rasikravindrae TaxID=990691 RepID=A0ABR1SWC5_9PEZI
MDKSDERGGWRSSIAALFHPFVRLPPELRRHIWDLALPRRIVPILEKLWDKRPVGTIYDGDMMVWPRWPTYATYVFEKHHRPPAVAYACREARSVAGLGRVVSADNSKSIPAHDRERYPIGNAIEYSWFDPERNTLLVEIDFPNATYPRTAIETHAVRVIKDLASCVRHVILSDSGSGDPHCFIEGLFNPRLFPCLRTIGVCTRELRIDLRESYFFLRTVFGILQEDHESIVIDLSGEQTADAREIDQLQRKLREISPGGEIDDFCEWLTALKKPHQPHHPGVTFRSRIKSLRNEYLNQCIMWTPLDGLRGWDPEQYPEDGDEKYHHSVLCHDEDTVYTLDTDCYAGYLIVPPPGWVEYAASFCPKIYNVASVTWI